MKQNIKDIITEITPSYESFGSFHHPMPNEVNLMLDDKVTYVDISLKDNVLEAEVSHKEEEILLDESDLDFLYKYLEELLASEILLTQMYYDEESYNDNNRYYYIK
tara:strand:- start:542 stop:859 length:318 start_codon:yes stop_codon:yes gene_type:complete